VTAFIEWLLEEAGTFRNRSSRITTTSRAA
jgi:hypothetical protein